LSKLPAFQFYPGDWRKDMGIQSLTYHDRGVWWEMLCLMHESERRGVLILNGQAMSEEALSRLLGLDKQTLTTTLTALLTSGVASREDDTGAIYSRRMVRDEYLRKVRAESGSKGGNPILLNHSKTTPVKQNLTPSSSSSSASSIKKEQKQKPSLKPTAPEVDKVKVTKTALVQSRHDAFKDAIKKYWAGKNPDVEMPWGPAEGKTLAMWLKESPTTTLDQFISWLRNRFQSEVNHTERPSAWIRKVTMFASGPIDRFGKPLSLQNSNGGRKNASVPDGTGDKILGVLAESLGRGKRENASWKDGGLSPSIQTRQDDPRTIHAVLTPVGPSSLPSGDAEFITKPKAGGGDGAPVPW